jgi:hypothetical protein
MPARDLFHEIVKKALENEGWNITHDPMLLLIDDKKMYVDLGAEILKAERDTEKIAVEIKSFLGASEMTDFHEALGQFNLYQVALKIREPDRKLYLAIPEETYQTLFTVEFIKTVITTYQIHLIVFNPETKKIVQWTK